MVAGNRTEVDVGLWRQASYDREAIKEKIDTLWQELSWPGVRSCRVLLKPNLISAKRRDGLPCTNGDFIAAVAEYLLDQGAVVTVGDSPAFGGAKAVMTAVGITEKLKGLPVELVDFSHGTSVRLAGGASVKIAREALECDLLLNLPKCKAHCQMLVTLAVKNFFGTVIGWRKPWAHMRHGENEDTFAAFIVDLLALFPESFSILDGIVALHGKGPVQGEAFELGLIAASKNPVALDLALLGVLGIEPERSALWRECRRRGLPGTDLNELHYPLRLPSEVRATGFRVVEKLTPVTFNPGRLLLGGIKRICSSLLPG